MDASKTLGACRGGVAGAWRRFTCVMTCSIYVYSDAIFDIDYVNADGHEIPADEALKRKS